LLYQVMVVVITVSIVVIVSCYLMMGFDELPSHCMESVAAHQAGAVLVALYGAPSGVGVLLSRCLSAPLYGICKLLPIKLLNTFALSSSISIMYASSPVIFSQWRYLDICWNWQNVAPS
jgi:hypothetical protein